MSRSLLFVLITLSLFSCVEKKNEAHLYLIPKPQEMKPGDGFFQLNESVQISIEPETDETKFIANYLADKIKPATGLPLQVVAKTASEKNISLQLNPNSQLGEEGYELMVTPEAVKLSAAKPAGLFRGVQTIRQLLPPAAESSSIQSNVTWTLPACAIRDFPNYAWRGFMLDVGRHFFGVDEVKRLLDEMAYYKMNVFHWGLSNDQGWRIEIKSWPKLTEVGGSTQVGGGKGGFYTQEQYKDVVKYAAERYITVVPEIDMPGHTNAALASYPELNCSEQTIRLTPGNEVKRKVPGLYTGIEVGFSTLCTSKESTYKFIDDVVRELAEMTPGSYLHIGGDESRATKKEDYILFINKVQQIVTSHGKKVIGWDEVALATLQPSMLAQVWANAANGKKAVEQGAKVILSPAKKMYLDMSYDSTSKLGLHWAAYVEVDSAYAWEPSTLLNGISRENILGIESALWTETIQTRSDIDYMVFPRLAGHAEIGWSATTDEKTGSRNWEEYKIRLANHAPRFKARGIQFYESKLVPWVKE
ncbi:MAG: beta-glycosyl hydrolase [Cytophagales bacterium]|jgi:hexosaminidase|nr:beta-N-acetylhexosaminidase [Bacteroidota bacterium]MBS1980287.1 beta-N-acetylhexosaminidase [Bacteroidota bacterium]WHZ08813.1 MAG: beta-glycosyl hydrolase [Cytophagales bacterium]